ncbi:hypothetical protein HDZ31DRAFT_64843 [Schizophyllum fasciatum]
MFFGDEDHNMSGLMSRQTTGESNDNSDTFTDHKYYLIVIFVGLFVVIILGIMLSAWCCKACLSTRGRATPLPKRETAAALNRFLLKMGSSTHYPSGWRTSQGTDRQSQSALFKMLDNMVIDDDSPLPTEVFPSSRRPSIDSGFEAWADEMPALVRDQEAGRSPEYDVPALPSSNLSGRFSPRVLSMVSTVASTVRPAKQGQRSQGASSSSDRSAVSAERRFGEVELDLQPRTPERAIYPRDYESIKDAMAKRIADWKGHRVETFGRLLLADELVVTRLNVDYVYIVYVFERIVVFAAEGKTGGRARQCLVGRRPYRMSFQAAMRSTPLNMKGRVYMMCVVCAVPSSAGGEPCGCTAGLSASVSPSSKSGISYPLALQFLNDDGGIESLTLHMPGEAQRAQWQCTIEEASSRECTKYGGRR